MTTPKLIPFRAEHMVTLSFRNNDRREAVRFAVKHEMDGPGFTAVFEDKIYGCAGVALAWPGVGTAWAVLTDELMKKFPIWTTRTVANFIQDIQRSLNLHRLEMVALGENVEWALLLGFSRERDGIAPMFTADKRDVTRLEMTWQR